MTLYATVLQADHLKGWSVFPDAVILRQTLDGIAVAVSEENCHSI